MILSRAPGVGHRVVDLVFELLCFNFDPVFPCHPSVSHHVIYIGSTFFFILMRLKIKRLPWVSEET